VAELRDPPGSPYGTSSKMQVLTLHILWHPVISNQIYNKISTQITGITTQRIDITNKKQRSQRNGATLQYYLAPEWFPAAKMTFNVTQGPQGHWEHLTSLD